MHPSVIGNVCNSKAINIHSNIKHIVLFRLKRLQCTYSFNWKVQTIKADWRLHKNTCVCICVCVCFNWKQVIFVLRLCITTQYLYVPMAWKQWLLPTDCAVCVLMSHPGMSQSGNMPGCALPLWCQYTYCRASVGSNHCWDMQKVKCSYLLYQPLLILLLYNVTHL